MNWECEEFEVMHKGRYWSARVTLKNEKVPAHLSFPAIKISLPVCLAGQSPDEIKKELVALVLGSDLPKMLEAFVARLPPPNE